MIVRRRTAACLDKPRTKASKAPVAMSPALASFLHQWRKITRYARDDDWISRRKVERINPNVPDSEAVYREWRRIVVRHNVMGVQVHDARLAAAMYVHGVAHILTLNVADFSRFIGLTAVHPSKP